MTTPSVSVINVDNAPLDREKLSTIGRFQLRRLADKLTEMGVAPIMATEASRQAFMGSQPANMAQTIYDALKIYRQANGLPTADESEAPEQEIVTSMTAAPAVTAEEVVQSVSEEVSKVFEQVEKPKRTPKTSIIQDAVQEVQKAAQDQSYMTVANAVDAHAVQAINDRLERATNALTAVANALNAILQAKPQESNTAALEGRIEELEAKLDLILGGVVLLGEADQNINVSQSEFIKAAEEVRQDLPRLLTVLEESGD